MVAKSPIEKLIDINPQAEIWWDSSPLVWNNFRSKMIAHADDKKKMTAWLDRLFNIQNRPQDNLFKGVTTNPPLSLNAIKDNPNYWAGWINERFRHHKGIKAEEAFWITYKEIVRRGAEIFLPIFEASNYKAGYMSGQLDPRICEDTEKMFAQALELRSLGPNIMVKVPGTKEGYEVIRRLTAQAIPTNNTLSFTIPQYIKCMESVVAGLKEARAKGMDLTRWRSVITAMSARFGNLGDLRKEAQKLKIELTDADVRWAEVAVLKKACQLVRQHPDYPGKMLQSSMLVEPQVQGVYHCWHMEKLAGADMVYTCPPPFIEDLFLKNGHFEFSEQIDAPVPDSIMDKLMQIPFFKKGYSEDGYTPEQFNHHPSLLETARLFSEATGEMVNFVARHLTA